MEFDFHQNFDRYSNVELLKIIRNPDQYQAEAIAAAQQILSERTVTENDERATDEFFGTVKKEEAVPENTGFSKVAKDLLDDPRLFFSDMVLPNWIRIGIIVVAIELLYPVCTEIKGFVDYYNHDIYFRWNPWMLLYLFDIGYVLAIFISFFKNKKVSWILAFGLLVITVIVSLLNIYAISKFRSDIGLKVLYLLLRLATCVFLWQKKVKTFFDVTESAALKTFAISAALGILFIAASYYLEI